LPPVTVLCRSTHSDVPGQMTRSVTGTPTRSVPPALSAAVMLPLFARGLVQDVAARGAGAPVAPARATYVVARPLWPSAWVLAAGPAAAGRPCRRDR
jgi:hypothetical protein